MSRSYKKHPVCKEPNRQKRYWKQAANRRIRRRQDVLNHRSYRKAFCSWMINDYRFRTTLGKKRLEWEESCCIHKRFCHTLTCEQWQIGDREYTVHENEPESWERAWLTWRKDFKFK